VLKEELLKQKEAIIIKAKYTRLGK